MNLQIRQPISVQNGTELKKQIVAAACGLGVSVATLAGIGAWQANGHESVVTFRHASMVTAQQRIKAASGQMAQAGTVFYLVGSPEQADTVRAGLDSDNQRLIGGAIARVMVVNSADEEARTLAAIDAEMESANHGGPVPQIYDLRNSPGR